MPVTHEFSRRAAALVTALALVMLPMTGTIAPANAEPVTSAEASNEGSSDPDPDGLVDGADAASAAEADGSTDSNSADDSASDDKESAVDGAEDSADPDEDADADPAEEKDPACDPDDETPKGEPCVAAEDLTATWGSDKTLKLQKPDGKPGSMPESWVDETFSGPTEDESTKRWPVHGSAEGKSSTDDSGNPVPSAAAPDATVEYSLNSEGYVVDASGKKMQFENFKKDPTWVFQSNGKNLTVEGDEYPDSDGDDDKATATADKIGTTDGATKETSTSADTSASSESKADTGADADNKGAASNGSTNNADSSATTSSDSKATSNSDSTTSSDTSSDSNSSDSANADSKDADNSDSADPGSSDADSADSADADSAKASSDSDSSAKSDGSDSASSDRDAGKDDKDSADNDGSGSTSGDEGPNGDDTTPDPETGNGSSDTRDEIPGDVGDDWMPGNGESSPPPDYSDPVPQNPDKPVPDDDTDLITGGDQPEPRGNNNPSTSFGESIISTIVSSWPVFILAAFGMAAVGFIIYLVGRRNKQN